MKQQEPENRRASLVERLRRGEKLELPDLLELMDSLISRPPARED